MNKAQTAQKAALVAALVDATEAHRADRKTTPVGEAFNADLFAAVKDAEAALADWSLLNVKQSNSYYTRPVFAAPWVQKRVAEQRAHARDIERRVAIAEAKKF